MMKKLIATVLLLIPIRALATPPPITWLQNRSPAVWVMLEDNSYWSEAVDKTLYPLANGNHGFIYRREWKQIAHADYPKYEYYYGELNCRSNTYGLYGVDYVLQSGQSQWRDRCQEMGCSIMDEPTPGTIATIKQKLCR